MSQRKQNSIPQEKKRKRLLLIFAYEIVVLLFLCVGASYTWLTLTVHPRVSSMNMYVHTVNGLGLSTDPGTLEWEHRLDFNDIVTESSPLRPVTWSNASQSLLAPTYGLDGRAAGWSQLSDDVNANTTGDNHYYIKATYYISCGQPVDVKLAPAMVVDESGTQGAGTYVMAMPEWDPVAIQHTEKGKGGECAIRFGFRITHVDSTGTPTGEGEDFFIYEPNFNRHVVAGLGYFATPSVDEGSDLTNLVSMDHLILQSASTWTESTPVEHGKLQLNLGTFLMNPTLVTLKAGQIARIDMYIWLEGQDRDCINRMNSADIFANIQFYGEPGDQSGMVKIE